MGGEEIEKDRDIKRRKIHDVRKGEKKNEK